MFLCKYTFFGLIIVTCRMMVIFSKFKIGNFIAITIYPFIFINYNYKGNKVLINHEKIHIKQQTELLWLLFFIWYITEFVIRYFYYKDWHTAYLNISFEREALSNEFNFSYLKYRKWYSFIKYI